MARIFGNLHSRLMEYAKQPVPEVGMGATICMFSDRHAVTVIEVNKDKTRVVVQRDKATRTDKNEMSDSQTYSYAPDANGAKETYTLRKSGRWVKQGDSMKNGTGLRLGERSEHFDFGF